MNYKPQSFTTLPGLTLIVAVAALLAVVGWQETAISADEKPAAPGAAASGEKTATPAADPANSSPDEAATSDPTADAASAAAADLPNSKELLDQVRNKLQGLDFLKCDLHETVMMSGMSFRAVGTYAEATGNRVRVEFRIFPSQPSVQNDLKQLALDAEPAVAAAETSRGELTQVSDGTVLFTHWKNGTNVSVTRRNLRDIMDAASKVAGYDTDHVAMDLGVGGLRGLISRI